MEVHSMEVHFMEVHFMEVHFMEVHLRGTRVCFRQNSVRRSAVPGEGP